MIKYIKERFGSGLVLWQYRRAERRGCSMVQLLLARGAVGGPAPTSVGSFWTIWSGFPTNKRALAAVDVGVHRGLYQQQGGICWVRSCLLLLLTLNKEKRHNLETQLPWSKKVSRSNVMTPRLRAALVWAERRGISFNASVVMAGLVVSMRSVCVWGVRDRSKDLVRHSSNVFVARVDKQNALCEAQTHNLTIKSKNGDKNFTIIVWLWNPGCWICKH